MAEKKPRKKPKQENVSTSRLMVLFTIVNRKKGEYYADLLQSFQVNLQMVFLGEGTADQKMLNYLGLAGSEKAVIVSVIREDKAGEALLTLEEKFNSIKDGKGIAYTVPMSSIIGVSAFGFLSDNRMVVMEDK